jgi:hypothetical protein
MKSLLPFILVLGLSSCREKTYCFACQTATLVATEYNGDVTTTTSKFVVDTCGITEDGARMYERANTDSIVSPIGGGKVTTKRVTGCI